MFHSHSDDECCLASPFIIHCCSCATYLGWLREAGHIHTYIHTPGRSYTLMIIASLILTLVNSAHVLGLCWLSCVCWCLEVSVGSLVVVWLCQLSCAFVSALMCVCVCCHVRVHYRLCMLVLTGRCGQSRHHHRGRQWLPACVPTTVDSWAALHPCKGCRGTRTGLAAHHHHCLWRRLKHWWVMTTFWVIGEWWQNVILLLSEVVISSVQPSLKDSLFKIPRHRTTP